MDLSLLVRRCPALSQVGGRLHAKSYKSLLRRTLLLNTMEHMSAEPYAFEEQLVIIKLNK